MNTLTVFVSSPGDVRAERHIVGKVIEKLQARYWNFIRLEPVLWEKEPVRATASFQKGIVRPSSCDVVVGILWNRLGTPLSEEFRKLDGERYESGTEWELCEAASGYERQVSLVGEAKARPYMLAYRRIARRLVEEDPKREDEAREQAAKMLAFENRFFFNPDGSAKRARFQYESLDEFERLFEPHLESLVRKELTAFVNRDGEIPIVPVSGSPFKGLQAFEVEDAPLFFGRFRAIEDVLNRLEAQKAAGNAFVMIYGSSGFGKSSLMRAGVASRLLKPGFHPGTDAWRFTASRPASGDGTLCEILARAIMGQSCLPELAQTIYSDPELGSHVPVGGFPGTWDVSRLTRALERNPKSCFDALSQALDRAAASDASLPGELNRPARADLCLLLDQFEEIFNRDDLTWETRDQYFQALGVLSTHPRVWILATLRSEYFPRLSEHDVLRFLTERDGGYLLNRPELAELHQIIRYPALAAGLAFETDPKTNESLSSRLYQDMSCDPGALPLLQFCLEQLYERRESVPETRLTWAAYRDIGGLQGAIATAADQTWIALSEEARSSIDQIFSALITVGEMGSLACRKEADYAALENTSAGAREFLRKFVEAKLLVVSAPGASSGASSPGNAVAALAHEALITHWPVLKEWIENHRDLLRLRRRLAEQTTHWVENRRDDSFLLDQGPLAQAEEVSAHGFFLLTKDEQDLVAHSRRRVRSKLTFARSAAVVFALLGLGAILLAWEANRQNCRAQQMSRAARTARIDADQLSSFMLRGLYKDLELAGRLNLLQGVIDPVSAYFARSQPTDWDSLRSRIQMRISQARILRATGHIQSAIVELQQAHTELAGHRFPTASTTDRNRLSAEVLLWLGDAESHSPNLLTLSETHLQESVRLLRQTSGSEARNLLTEALMFLADTQRQSGQRGDAIASYKEGLVLAETSGAADSPELTQSQLEILDRLGNLHFHGGEFSAAAKCFERMRTVATAHSQSHPSDLRGTANVARSGLLLGSLYLQTNQTQMARDSLMKAVKTLSELVVYEPSNAFWRRDLGEAHHQLGDLLQTQQLAGEALVAHQEGLRQIRQAAIASPGNAFLQMDLASSLRTVGSVLLSTGRSQDALPPLEESTSILLRLGEQANLPGGSWLTN